MLWTGGRDPGSRPAQFSTACRDCRRAWGIVKESDPRYFLALPFTSSVAVGRSL